MVDVPAYKRKRGRQYQLGLESGERIPPRMQDERLAILLAEGKVPYEPHSYYGPLKPVETVRDRLMERAVYHIAYGGEADDTIYVGLPEGETEAEYHLVGLSKEEDKKFFIRQLREEEEVDLNTTELEWLARQVGAIVEEESGSGMSSVDFYEDPISLAEAWKEYGKKADEVNQELIEEGIKSGQLTPSGEVFSRSQTRLDVAGPDEYGRVHNPEAPEEFQ